MISYVLFKLEFHPSHPSAFMRGTSWRFKKTSGRFQQNTTAFLKNTAIFFEKTTVFKKKLKAEGCEG